MSILTLSPLAKEIFGEVSSSPEEKAIDFMITGIKEYLKECELEILEYETKYGFSIDELKKEIASGEIADEFSYPLETDLMKWEDLITEKKNPDDLNKKNRQPAQMKIDKFKIELFSIVKKYFPQSKITAIEKRLIILEARINISQDIFIEIYYNSLTDKKNYALISEKKRIFGYDNYKNWHFHPIDNPLQHIPCIEPPIDEVFCKIKDIISTNLF